MKKKFICFIIFIFSAGLVWSQEAQMFVRPKAENIRISPNGTKIGELLSGTDVRIVERRANWVKVQFSGWIWGNSLTPDSTAVYGFQVRASHILVKTREEADSILKQLKQGSSFEELARQHSIDEASGKNGGDIGVFGKGDFRPEFENAVFRLKKDQLSDVVQTSLGFHIVKRTE